MAEDISTLKDFIRQVPKVELHVHLEGSILPETLLKLARRNHIALPADDLEGLRKWYRFIDFPHFADIYHTISKCIRTADDIELITRDFLKGQAAQNIIHTEATYTAFTMWKINGLAFDDQLAAINRAREWGKKELGVNLLLIIDIPRQLATADEGEMIADWVIRSHGNGVAAMGLGGYEVGFPPEMFRSAFDKTNTAGIPAIIHAGETAGPESIWGAINALNARRIGHGVRCLEDPELVDYLHQKKIPLEVCPTSNVCLKVVSSLAEHPLPALMKKDLILTINSDDPPMFNTTLTDEFLRLIDTFNFSSTEIFEFMNLAAGFTLLHKDDERQLLEKIAAPTREYTAKHNKLILDFDELEIVTHPGNSAKGEED